MSNARYKESKQTVVLPGSVQVLSGDNEADDDAPMLLDPDRAEPTLAERLRLVSVQKGEALTTEELEAAGLDASAEASALPVPPANSLAQTLVQALHSTDSRLLESCLQHSDRRVIQNTVKRLPTQLVSNLVEELVVRLGRGKGGQGEGTSAANENRARGLIEWVRQVLTIHVSYLVTIPSLVNRLAALHATLQSRLELHNKLLSLNGRLELIVSQIDMRREAPPQYASLPRAQPYRYVEGQSSDEELVSDPEDESEEEGSVQDVELDSASSSEDDSGASDEGQSESGEDEQSKDGEDRGSSKQANGVNGFLELEAEDGSGSDPSDRDDQGMAEAPGYEGESAEDDEDESQSE